jgi:hypothetical protein
MDFAKDIYNASKGNHILPFLSMKKKKKDF